MFEDDNDTILPEDFEDTPIDEAMEDMELDESIDTETEDTKPVEEQIETSQPTQEEPDFSVLLKAVADKAKFNHGPVEVNSIDDLVANFQKGLVMDKAVERARSEAAQQARDTIIAEMGMTWNGKPISTEAEYKAAKEEERIYKEVQKLAQREGIPEEFAERMIKLEQREAQREKESQAERAARETQERQQADFNDFLKYFQDVNERPFDHQKDGFPQEVLAAVNNGQPLKMAYMEYHNKELRNQLKISKQNELNSKKSPVGSLTAGGGVKTTSKDDFLEGFDSVK